MHNIPVMPLSLGLIGYGAFGAFLQTLAGRFLPDAALKVYSSSRPVDGVRFFPLEDVAACDAVILTVPISIYGDMLTRILPHVREDTVIVDVATVKQHTMDLIERLRPNGPFIATHPMFGPESYKKRDGDVGGLRVVVTGHSLGPQRYGAVLAALRAAGFTVIEKTAEAHDRELAETLFLTHYIGQVIAQGKFERTDIDTVSFGFLMDAVDSVRHDGQLFSDVCRYNRFCPEVIKRFDTADGEVRDQMLGSMEAGRGQ